MFIEGLVEYRPGIEAERFVWKHVKSEFSSRECFGFLHFPMFKKNHAGKREIDILLVDRELGVNIIEVKGINIEQIDYIQGHKWQFRNYHSTSGEPFNQAEQQLNMLCDDIEKKAILYRTFSKRAMVALPYITHEQWKKRGFSQQLNNPFILFKDDFEKGTWIQKLKQIQIYKARININDYKWLTLKKHFFIKDQQEEINNKRQNHYSSLYIFVNEKQFLEEKENIETKLKEGVKIYIFSDFSISKNWLTSQENFVGAFQLQVFHSKELGQFIKKQIIIDGEVEKSFLKDILAPAFPMFNVGQFIATHTPINEKLMITAGAGTGKTHVMIDRIFYLLEKADITLKDIVMITFTNASTDEMKERLKNRLISMFNLTGKTKYLYFAEEVKNMQISTIHSFSKSILTQLAHEIGFGRNVTVRSFIKIKNDIIESLIDEFFKEYHVKDLVKLKLTHYSLIKMVRSFWDELERKGLTKNEIESLDWGKVVDEKYRILNDLFQYVFERCEGLLEIVKKKENAIDTGDMIRKLKLFTQGDKMKQLQMEKYLFIDEFQDSDNTQIELVACLRNQLNYQLFVVGDIKQSIYRFRGADYTSFERLEERAGKFEPVTLNQNYRTTSSLLSKLDKVFSVWGQKRWGPNREKENLLPYSKDDCLIGMELTKPTKEEFLYPRTKKEFLESETVEQIRKSFEVVNQLPDNENKKIALIVRTNNQALEVRKWCERAKIGTSQNLDGTFYKSEAVLHFKMLLDALLYSNEARYIVNLLHSPYFNYKIPSKLLVSFKGNNDKLIEFLISHIGNDFTQYLEDLRKLPVLAVIQKIMAEKGLLNNIHSYYEAKFDNDLTIETSIKQYEKNLYYLMNIIQQQFDSMNSTLWSIHEWISLQIRVNRSENEPLIETNAGVEITTVHRSKGLEYHTVIMPKLSHPFDHDLTSFYVQDEKEMNGETRMVGWKLRDFQNNNFSTLQNYESFEVQREETRLLYVAMTRAKKRLILVMPKKAKSDTWGWLLESALDEVNYED
ncbi:UvrD-helicase domain-containing protein [Gottfriedia sp. NPDC057948]|uniref:UvrD-helicase domain-containing protein n=1 Tax=Gottfriedia sp. NPDC057948 TaxID=3346287 RepID=UPI0036DD69BC